MPKKIYKVMVSLYEYGTLEEEGNNAPYSRLLKNDITETTVKRIADALFVAAQEALAPRK